MSKLTPEQLQRIEENRKKALEKRALREKIEANRKRALQTLATRAKERQKAVDDYRPPLSEYRKYYDPSLPNPVIKRFSNSSGNDSQGKPATVTSSTSVSDSCVPVNVDVSDNGASSFSSSSEVHDNNNQRDKHTVQTSYKNSGTSANGLLKGSVDVHTATATSSSLSSCGSGSFCEKTSVSSSSALDNNHGMHLMPSINASRTSVQLTLPLKVNEVCHSVSSVPSTSVSNSGVVGAGSVKQDTSKTTVQLTYPLKVTEGCHSGSTISSTSVSNSGFMGGSSVNQFTSSVLNNNSTLPNINPSGNNVQSTLVKSGKNTPKLHGGCRLVSTDRFVVEVGYHHVMIDIFKSISSALYDSMSKRWSFHIRDHNKLLRELQILKDDVSVSGIPKKVLDIFLRPAINHKNVELSNIDPELVKSLMPFQKEGVQYGISRGGRCLIADDIGLGKTIQVLGIAHYYKSNWPLLVICPTSVRYQWLEAFRSWLPSVSECYIFVMTSKNDFDESAQVLITSYNLVSRHANMISTCNFGVVILDESHFLKAPKAARTEAAMSITKRCKRVILLSGTPALSRPSELYTQLHAVDSKTFHNFREFGIRYCAGRQTNLGFWDYNGSSNMEELNFVLQKCFMIRRLKSDVLTELPSKMRQMIVLNPCDIKHTKEMENYERTLQNKYLKHSERRSTLLEYYATSGKVKLPAIIEYISDKLESGKKFIIFAHHQAVMDGICETVYKKNISFIRIDGKVSSANRKELCDKFQYDERCLVAVLSITAANVGITLTSAQLVIFAELFWNPGVLTQAEDRAHRIGQQDCVVVQYLVATNTADDHIWPLIKSKLEVLNKAGLSKDSFQGDLTSTVTYNSPSKKKIKDFFIDLDSAMNDDDDNALLEAIEFADI